MEIYLTLQPPEGSVFSECEVLLYTPPPDMCVTGVSHPVSERSTVPERHPSSHLCLFSSVSASISGLFQVRQL